MAEIQDSTAKHIFMLMPFDEKLDEIYVNYIKEPLENKGYLVKRADDFYKSTDILEDILNSIENSDIIIAELTNKNPNVFYEVGYAHHVQKEKVILISQEEKIPFDLITKRVIKYKDSPSGYEKLKNNIIKFVITVDTEVLKPVIKKLIQSYSNRAPREIINNIKADELEYISDFILNTNTVKLQEICKHILAELLTYDIQKIKTKDHAIRDPKIKRLLDFIKNIFEIQSDPWLVNFIFRLFFRKC